jgi:hypothetical protein
MDTSWTVSAGADITSACTMYSKGAQNLQIAVVSTVIPGSSLRTFALKILKLFSNLAQRESFF